MENLHEINRGVSKFAEGLEHTRDQRDRILIVDMYTVYFNWCADNNYPYYGKKFFIKALDDKGFITTRFACNKLGYRAIKYGEDLELYL